MEGFIAHVRRSDNTPQSLVTHLTETAAIAKLLAAKLDLDLAAELLGLMHDFGKYSRKFQKYIHDATGLINPDLDEEESTPNSTKVDHSTAGAQWVYRRLQALSDKGSELCGQMLGLCIASHHGAGLIDCLDPEEGEAVWQKRLVDKKDALTHLSECACKADTVIVQRADVLANKDLLAQMLPLLKSVLRNPDISHQVKEFYLGCFTRFLFSCLIDADRINSSDFEREHQKSWRRFTQKTDWQEAIDKLEAHLSRFEIRYPIDQIRRDISAACLSRAEDAQGIYTLTVPTGGGKTLASLRYALHHAKKHDLDRIIYIIPA